MRISGSSVRDHPRALCADATRLSDVATGHRSNCRFATAPHCRGMNVRFTRSTRHEAARRKSGQPRAFFRYGLLGDISRLGGTSALPPKADIRRQQRHVNNRHRRPFRGTYRWRSRPQHQKRTISPRIRRVTPSARGRVRLADWEFRRVAARALRRASYPAVGSRPLEPTA
jgi:hypothetical protein